MEYGAERLVHRLLGNIADDDPGVPLVRFLDIEGECAESLTRGDVWLAARRFAAAVVRAGAGRGDRVLTMVGNRPEFFAAFFGTLAAGMVVVPMNTAARGGVLRAAIAETAPAVIVVDQVFAAQLAEVADAAASARLVLVGEEDAPALRARTPWAAFLDGVEPAEPVVVEPEDLAALMFTSGTTGPSKAVMCSHNMMVTWAEAVRSCIGHTASDIAFTCLPIYHGNGLCCTVLPAILGGATLAVAPKFSASNFWMQVVRSGATTTNLLGAMGNILWRRDPEPIEQAHSLRNLMIIPSPVDHFDAFEKRFAVTLTELYGLTDSAVPIAVPHGERRPGSCGLPTAGWECALVDDRDRPVADGAVGELVLRPRRPYVAMSGYWNRPEATVEAWRNLWFHTGDYLRRDADGWFWFVDRRKDTIRRGGENVSSWEVEQAVLAHPAVLDAAAYAVDDAVMGHEVMVSVLLRPGVQAAPQEMVDHCRDRLPRYAVPRYVVVLERFPMTETEKVQKSVLRDSGLVSGTWDAYERRVVGGG